MELIPQLADSIDKARLPDFINSDTCFFEQKVDGWRKLIWLRGGRVEVYNRQGKPADLPQDVFDSLPRIEDPEGICLDGELVGDVFFIFDLPFAVGVVTPDQPYSWRRAVLDEFAPRFESPCVQLLPSAKTTEDKMALARTVINAGGEGLMVKDANAAYLSGRRHAGVLKAKFVKDVDAFITRFGIGLSSNGSGLPKSNCEVAVFTEPTELTEPVTPAQVAAWKKDGRLKVIGEVIIHPKERNQVRAIDEPLRYNGEDFDRTSVAMVAYLYCVDPNVPRLVQPTRIRPRWDKGPGECVVDQLKFTDKSVHSWDDIKETA